MFSERGRQKLLKCAAGFIGNPGNLLLNWEHLLNQYVVDNPMAACFEQSDKWAEIDTPEDYADAQHKFEKVTDNRTEAFTLTHSIHKPKASFEFRSTIRDLSLTVKPFQFSSR
jgi:hypothetical protein